MVTDPVQEAFKSVRVVDSNVSIGGELLVPPHMSAWFVNLTRTRYVAVYSTDEPDVVAAKAVAIERCITSVRSKLALVDCGRKGVGLVAMEFFDADEYVGEYVGEVLTNTEATFQSRYYGRLAHYYMLRMSANQAIDATHFGGRMRFINHSCDPNCVFEKWNVCGQERCGVLLRAKCKEVRNLLSTITFTMSIVRYDDNKRICCGFI
ncbi:SET domain-containing protein [Phytophthora infestans]|uniref:SET domain-containing protein n=1 Tax=Phytophthora infestans TaxID=4787 RepID=A0A8S9VBT9_PHYIN|nr:SET domain-containing protein [Phytophthora infestans]